MKKAKRARVAAAPTRPLVSQVIEAVIDGAAEFAKGVAAYAASRIAKTAEKATVGKASPVARRATRPERTMQPSPTKKPASGPQKPSSGRRERSITTGKQR